MGEEAKVHLPLRVPESYIERLDALAESMGLDRSEVARRVIREGLNDLELGEKIVRNPIGEKLLLFTTLLEADPEERAEMTRAIRSVAMQKKAKKRATRKKPHKA